MALANRWGCVSRHGVEITLSLTHEVIGEIVGARRRTITLALGRMARRNIIGRGTSGKLILLRSPHDWTVTQSAVPQIPDGKNART